MCERVPLSDSLTRLSLCVRESLRPYAIEFRRQLLRPLGWAEGGAEAGSVRTCMPPSPACDLLPATPALPRLPRLPRLRRGGRGRSDLCTVRAVTSLPCLRNDDSTALELGQ